MVALHPVPSEPTPLDPSLPDDDLVIALAPDAMLDRAGAEALVEFASADPADGWCGDITIAGTTSHRPAWSPTRLLVDPLAAAPVAVRAGWLRAHHLSSGAPDLSFRLARAGADVVHVTAVLTQHDSPLPPPDRDVVDEHLAALALPIERDGSGDIRPTADFAPEVSIVVPTAGRALPDGTAAIARLIERLGPLPSRYELVLVVGDEFEGEPADLHALRTTVVRREPGPFNFSSAVNLGVLRATHEHVLLLNDDTEPDGPEFVDQLAMHLVDSSVAAVGALLTYPDGSVQHAGIIIDDARPLHPFVGWDPAQTADHGGLLVRDVAAVTGGCMMLRRADFLAVGGLSTSFPLSFNDVDLCVRLRRTGGRVIVEPGATLVHHETLSREPVISPDEWDRWIDRWGEIVDPWYHPGYHRPDDPHALSRNVDHLPPRPGDPALPPQARRPVLASRVHRGRHAITGR